MKGHDLLVRELRSAVRKPSSRIAAVAGESLAQLYGARDQLLDTTRGLGPAPLLTPAEVSSARTRPGAAHTQHGARGPTTGPASALLLAAFAGYEVAGAALRPVERIRVSAARIGESDLTERLPQAGTGDELDRLTQTLNDLLARLSDALKRERRIVGDASHDVPKVYSSTTGQW